MDNKKKNRSYQNKNTKKGKKVLENYDNTLKKNNKKAREKKQIPDKLLKEIRNEIVNKEFEMGKSDSVPEFKTEINIHEKIQSFISILFTIIVFILLLFLIMVIYNNYLKPKKEIDVEEVCKDYIKKDYNIKEESILNYIKEKRSILYNLDNFDREHLTNENLLTISKFIIWDSSSDYELCDEEEICLVTKKEIAYEELMEQIKEFLKKENLTLDLTIEQNDKIRLYQRDDKVVLTFSEFEFESLKHEMVDILVEEDMITVYFALSEKIPNTNYYNYVGSKKMILRYQDNQFVLSKMETNIKE